MDGLDELDAMRTVAKALDPLDSGARARVMHWIGSKYDLQFSAAVKLSAPQVDEATEAGVHSNFAEFFDFIDPQTESEKALVGGYWLQKRQGMTTFDSATVNRELKNLGHAVRNITAAFDDLMELRPALAVQTAKAGKSQQARKKYMITKAGEKFIQQKLSGDEVKD